MMQRRFSHHFGIGKSQAELDFVDIPLDTDIRLFVDPYALSVAPDAWFAECNNIVVSYFELLIESIRAEDTTRALALLSNLREANDTHLGLSKGHPAGRGVGREQAKDLYEALRRSKAVKTGYLNDLSDCELHVPNISSDKISDMTINLIRGQLVDYTEQQCAIHGVPTTQVASGMYWDVDRSMWANRYAKLPVYAGQRIVLVPKAAVRLRMGIDHQKYYHDYVLEYLQAEHLNAGTGLVEMLRNGKRRVTKKSLKREHPLSKEFLTEFSQQHPEVLMNYKQSVRATSKTLRDEDIERTHPEPAEIDIEGLIAKLDSIACGGEHATEYHNYIVGALETVFFPQLRKPVKEQEINEGRKRVDLVFNNGAEAGFFADMQIRHKVFCPYVFFECKNYSADLKNPEFDQLIGRFSDKRGLLGFIVCRRNDDQDAILRRCRDALLGNRGVILILDDVDLRELLKARAAGDFARIDDHLEEKYRKLVL